MNFSDVLGASTAEEKATEAENQAKVAAAMFAANPLNAIAAKNAAETAKAAADARAFANSQSPLERVYGPFPIPLYGYGIGAGVLALIGVATKFVFGKKR